jgi:hypothetical protein
MAKGEVKHQETLTKMGADLVQQNSDLIEDKLGPKSAYLALVGVS